MARRQVLLLLLLGLLSIATYLCAFAWPYSQSWLAASGSAPDLGVLTGHSPVACALYVGAVTTLFGLYVGAIRLASRLREAPGCAVVITCGLDSGSCTASASRLPLGSRCSSPFGLVVGRSGSP